MLEGIRQQQEAMRLQLQQQSQIQQQMFTFFSGCFGQLYRHTGLPEPQLPTPQQLQFDPTAPAPPVGGFVQTPLSSFPMSPFLQTGLFASPVPTAALPLLHSLVFGLPSSVQSSLGSSRFYTSSSTRQLSHSRLSHPISLRCSVRLLCTPLSQT